MAGRPQQDPARQLERAHLILDAAAELVLRWGYDKTTVDDVSKQAGVAKGTIYLHWKTRDELFAALLRRERVRMLSDVRQSRPQTLRDLLRELAAALLRHPLMKAIMLSDTEVLGKLARQKQRGPGTLEQGLVLENYLGELIKLGVLRSDRTPVELYTIVSSTLYGFLMMQGMLPDSQRIPDDRLTEVLADAGERAMSSPVPPAEVDAEAIARATLAYLDTVAELAERKLAGSLRSV